ncbi:dockerin type I repeat-containing protein, partial [Ruminococcus flavefaciens]|uniref:dockerin type I repeat-containing protein n=1 Tax=Ruminococcus flavefaciens TaxID=1265 RepID=UPI0026EF4A16
YSTRFLGVCRLLFQYNTSKIKAYIADLGIDENIILYSQNHNDTLVSELSGKIVSLPDKLEYNIGEQIDLTGIRIEAAKWNEKAVVYSYPDVAFDYQSNIPKPATILLSTDFRSDKAGTYRVQALDLDNVSFEVKVVDNAATSDTTASPSTKPVKNDPTMLKGTKEMSLDDVKEIAKKKKNITWSDFADFNGEWNATDTYTQMCRFELEDGYYLLVEGNPPEAPEIIRLYHKDDPNFIDLRYHSVEKFIDEQFYKELQNMSEEELKAFFNEKGMTEEKGYRVWTKETALKALDNYFLTFLVALPASFTDKSGNTIINETTDKNDLSKMANDNSFGEQLSSFLGNFKVNINNQISLSSHFVYRSEDNDGTKVYRRYIIFNVYGSWARDTENQLLAGALNYIQFSPQFAGFEYEGRIPRYGTEDTGKLKGDANNDDQVDMSDVVFIMQCLANPDKYVLSEEGKANADIDGDGVTVGDAQSIQKRLLGIIDYITDLDTIRTMLSDYAADQMLHITVVPKEKMPEQFADKYVFVSQNSTHGGGSSYDEFLSKNYIDQSNIRNIPYDIDDDSELNKLCEKLYLFALENGISGGVYKYKDKIRLVYDFRHEDYNEKMDKFIKDNNIDPDMIMKEILE